MAECLADFDNVHEAFEYDGHPYLFVPVCTDKTTNWREDKKRESLAEDGGSAGGLSML